MDYGKYIIVETNCQQAILFDNTMAHADFLTLFNRDCIISAGFFQVSAQKTEFDPDNVKVGCFGKSITLGLESRGEKDERLIKRIIRKDLY